MNTIIKRRVLISMLFIGLVLMGVFSYKYIPMELYPNADLPVLYVSINAKMNSIWITLKNMRLFRWKELSAPSKGLKKSNRNTTREVPILRFL